MIRLFDIVLASFGLVISSPLLLLLAAIGWFDTQSPLFLQIRIGYNQKPFTLIKFRSMHVGTASVATHIVNVSAITPFGNFLRRTKLDELPQLWNVLKGEMSLVGPRPCLPNQYELIDARKALDVFRVRPGITGLAQIQGIDMSNPKKLAQVDASMLQNLSLYKYFHYILQTITGKGQGDKVQK